MAPVVHRYDPAELEVSVTLPPAQKETGPDAVMVGTGPLVEFVTTAGDETTLTPLEFVTRTEYDPGDVTVIERVVCPPGDHR